MHVIAEPLCWEMGPLGRGSTIIRAAVAAPEAPPATTAATDAKSLYMPLQNGSDVRGVAVEGERHLHNMFSPSGDLRRDITKMPARAARQ